MITIAGLDPSLSNLGMSKGQLDLSTGHFSLTDLVLTTTSSTKIKTVRKNSDDLERAKKLYTALFDFLTEVDIVCVEIPVGSKSSRAQTSYGICIGVLAGIKQPLIQVTPTEVKLAATGNRLATKDQMIKWAVSTYPDGPWLTRKVKGVSHITGKNEHLADAVASIHAGVKTDQFKILKTFLEKENANRTKY